MIRPGVSMLLAIWLSALPVWAAQAPYEMGEGELGFETLTDADGLRAWLASDGFHMAK